MTAPSKFSFRTGTFLKLNHDDLAREVDRALPRLYDSHAELHATAIKSPVYGQTFAVKSGEATVTGSLLRIQTGLTKVNHVVVSLVTATASNVTVTGTPSSSPPGAIDIFCWKPTAAGNTTPIADTVAQTVHWWATGDAVTTT